MVAFCLALFFSNPLLSQTNQTTPGCQDIATIPPVLTLGGTGTAPAHGSELGLAAGAYGNLFPLPCAHDTGVVWFGRWRYGISKRFDLGADFQGAEHSSNQALAVKMAARYELFRSVRLEGGVGVGDDTLGKSLNAEVGATFGNFRSGKLAHDENDKNGTNDRNWDPYVSIRLAAAHGYAGNAFGIGTTVPPGALVPMASVGTSARVSEGMRCVFEAGGGGIVSREHLNAGMFVYVGVGLKFVVHKRH